jgi:HemK-related putative methylase
LNGIYQPGEDSVFLCQTVEKVRRKRVAEIGVGSGFVLRNYAAANELDLAVGTDIDVGALKLARLRDSSGSIEYVLCRSCDGLRERSLQLIFFNPPYLGDEGVEDLATWGGEAGVEVTYEMVCSSYRALTKGGSLVFLASSLSNVESLSERLRADGMKVMKLNVLKLFFEELYAFKIVKKTTNRKSR